MITNADWDALQQKLAQEDRAKLGQPPTPEELERYMNGELAGDEEARIRELLVAYPHIASALTAPFPERGEMPDDELSRQWAALQQRLHKQQATVVPFRRRLPFAIAAMLALIFAGLYVQAKMQLRTHDLEPRHLSGEKVLLPDGQRGGGELPATIAPDGARYLLAISIVPTARYQSYRVTLVDAQAKPLWSKSIPATDEQALLFDVPRAFLAPGRYQAIVDGAGARPERVATYSFEVVAR